MSLDFLPPQAYTKETLLKAYNWLQGQTEQVREMAGTPDQLVSLYLKAKHHGQEALERPSLQNFKSELKNLAGMMGDLEKKKPATAQPATTPTQPNYHQPGSTSMMQYQVPQASVTVTQQQAPSAQMSYQGPPSQPAYQGPVSPSSQTYQAPVAPSTQPAAGSSPFHPANYQTTTVQTQVGGSSPPLTTNSAAQSAISEPTPAQKAASSYDELTLKMIREVKNELNLSSEMEAMRMLVKLGYQKAQTLYK